MSRDDKPGQPEEKDAVFTTIVGGRPPGSGTQVGGIPRGVEVLVKKASVDTDFRRLLLEKRGEAAREIDLELTDAERKMLSSIPAEQLEKIIDNTKVAPEHRDVFLGTVGKVMLAVLISGAAVSVMMPSLGHRVATTGISPDRIRQLQMERNGDIPDVNDPNEADLKIHLVFGIRSDRPPETNKR